MQPPPLTLKHCVISNFKSLKRVELAALNNLVVLMGRNNAGKSNILDCFNFLVDASRNLEQALATHGGSFSEIIYKKRDAECVEVVLEFEMERSARAGFIDRLFADNKGMDLSMLTASDFLATLRLKVRLGKDLVHEELTATNTRADASRCLLFQHKESGGAVEWVTGQLEDLCKWANGELPVQPKALEWAAVPAPLRLRLGKADGPSPGEITAELGALVYEQFASLQWMDPHRNMPSSAPIHGEQVLTPNASNLPDVLHWLHNNKPAVFRRLEAEVHKLVPHLGKLYTPTAQNTASLGAMDPEDEELFYTMNQLSYGTKSAVAVIAKLVLASPGSWFSIEEPETYLHPLAQMGLFRFLREESRTKRIFVATHSTAIAASTPIDSLFIVQRDVEYSTVADPVTEHDVYRVIDQLGVQPSFSFDSEAIVFVEDEDDVPVWEAWARKFSFQVHIQFLAAEEGVTPRFFANARIALSKYVHTLVYAVFGSGSATPRDRVVNLLKLPHEQVVTLDSISIAALLMDAAAIRRAFPSVNQSEADLGLRLDAARSQDDQKKALAELLHQLKAGPWSGELAARIADTMEIPASVRKLFERIDLASKPFWKI